MTTDTQLAPTDDEIDALWALLTRAVIASPTKFAREVLARWGQPSGAVPMTPEQRDALWESCKYDDGEEWTVDWEQIVDAVERHHRIGVKGGQHGTE